MTRIVKFIASAALLLAGSRASGQILNALDRQAGFPSGLALPVPGLAVAEEPAALGANPAAVGFVGKPALQYFHEGGVTEGSQADGLYGATGLGPFGIGYSSEWIRPGAEGPLERYRKGTFALSLGDHRALSLGFGWNTYWSADPAMQGLSSWGAGLTVRPWRHLSLAIATLDRDAVLGGTRLPARYEFGAATRLLADALTLSADLIADDRAKDDLHLIHVGLGVLYDGSSGLGLGAQVLLPVNTASGVSRAPSVVAVLTFNTAHVGVSAGAASTPEKTGWLAGARLSVERYAGFSFANRAPTVDVDRELSAESPIPFLDLGEKDPYGVLVERLHALAEDDRVPAVAVRIGDLPIGWGRVEELREALIRIGAKKPVVAYLTGGSTREYWLASAASAITMPPGSTLQVTGLATSNFYLREALGRLGIAFEVIAAGAYKSAPEPLVRDAPSPASREMTESLLDDRYGRLVQDFAAARRLPPDRVRALVDRGLFGSREAKEAGLVDQVLWPDEFERYLSAAVGRTVVLAGPYRPEPLRVARRWGRPPVIEVIRLEGMIVSGRTSRGGLFNAVGAETVASELRAAADDPEVKAIVLRVESPGGDGLASDFIWRAVEKAREKKPVIASMGDVAASGGYLAAAAADTILADPQTLTGSIGVFVFKPELSGLLAKLGVSRSASSRGEIAELESFTKPWTAKERAAIEGQIEAFYQTFVDRVAEGRKLPREKVAAVAGGRVWSGRQALDRGLIDRLGTLEDAISLALSRAGISREEAEVRRSEPGLSAALASPLANAMKGPLERALEAIPEVRALAALSEMGPVVALPLEWVTPVR